MKLLLVNDSHFGLRSDSQIFRNYFARFFEEILFPYAKKHGITTCVHLGDFLDRRKFVNFETLQESTKILQDFKKHGIDLHILLGNHDTYFKNTSALNSLELLYKNQGVQIYKDCTDITINGKTFAIVPWLNDENINDFRMFLTKTKAKVAFGHFELRGFQVMRGVECDHGLDPVEIDQFDKIYSGHFHQRHDNGKVFYLGTQYDMTFSDVDETKGFHVLDTDTMDLEFVPNPHKMFYKIAYTDTTDISKLDLRDCYVKIIVSTRPSAIKFEKFLEEVYGKHPYDVTIIEEYELFSNNAQPVDQTKDTVTIICDEIDSLSDIDDKPAIKRIIAELYTASQNVEDADKENDD